MCSITGIGERLHKVLGQIGSKLWFPWQQKPPLTYNGENNVSTFSRLIVIWYFLYLQVTRTCIKSRTSSNFCQIEPLTTELYALSVPIAFEWGKWYFIFSQLLWIQTSSNLQEMRTGIKSQTGLNFGHIWLVILELPALQPWKKWCLQLFSVTFDWVFVKLAGNEDRHKSSNKFEFGSDRIIHFGVICPWAPIFFLIPGAIYMY